MRCTSPACKGSLLAGAHAERVGSLPSSPAASRAVSLCPLALWLERTRFSRRFSGSLVCVATGICLRPAECFRTSPTWPSCSPASVPWDCASPCCVGSRKAHLSAPSGCWLCACSPTLKQAECLQSLCSLAASSTCIAGAPLRLTWPARSPWGPVPGRLNGA